MKTLFISTYNELITIGLLDSGRLIIKKENISERSHSAHLTPLINELLESQNLLPNSLNEIVVINGPGSFTGVRLGITVAKTLAYTLNIPIKTINTLDALALSNSVLDKKIIKIDDSKGSYYGLYENNQLISKLQYLNKESFNKMLKETQAALIENEKLDIEAIYQNVKKQEALNPHEIKPLYIKTIEVLND